MSYEEINACARKSRYSSLAFASGIIQKWRRQGKILRAYPCAFCKGFHLTSAEAKAA